MYCTIGLYTPKNHQGLITVFLGPVKIIPIFQSPEKVIGATLVTNQPNGSLDCSADGHETLLCPPEKMIGTSASAICTSVHAFVDSENSEESDDENSLIKGSSMETIGTDDVFNIHASQRAIPIFQSPEKVIGATLVTRQLNGSLDSSEDDHENLFLTSASAVPGTRGRCRFVLCEI